MKIIQLNVWGGKLVNQIGDFLRAEKPDFVCLQEVNDLKGRAGYHYFATLDDFKKDGGFDEAFMSPLYSARFMRRTLRFGNAIMSRLPFVSTETVFTGGEFVEDLDVSQDDANMRNLQITEIGTGGSRLAILNHHGFYVEGSKAGNDETMRQMQIIAEAIDQLQGPIILCGDFNLSPGSQSLGLINDKLTNLSVVHGLERTYNQFSKIHDVCDYIFVNDQVKVRDFRMSDELLSDHKALILEFDL